MIDQELHVEDVIEMYNEKILILQKEIDAYLTADIGTKLGIPAYIVYYNIEGADYPTFKIAKINTILEEIDPISEGSLIELNEQEYIGYLNWLRQQHVCKAKHEVKQHKCR